MIYIDSILYNPVMTTQISAPANFRLVLVGLLLAMTLAALDQNIVSPALPRIVGDLGGLSLLSWVVTAFMVASTTTAPLYGKLSDMYGRRPAFFVSILIFLVGSIMCGQAHSIGQLIGYRALQGIGAGGLMTLAQTTIGDLVSPRERGRYQGVFAGVFAICSVAGPLLGGFITEDLSWRWIFYVNLPVGAASLGCIALGLTARTERKKHRIDFTGAILLIIGTVSALMLLSCGGTILPWTSPTIVASAVAVCIVLGLLGVVERRAAEPILPPALFREPVFLRSVIVIGLSMSVIFGLVTFLPLFFQLELGASPSGAGLRLMALMGGVIVASFTGGRIVSRTGRYKIFPVLGLILATIGTLGMSWVALALPGPAILETMLFFVGLGIGFVMPNLTTAIQNSVQRSMMGVATSGTSFFRSLGAALGVAIAGAALNIQLAHLVPSLALPGAPAHESLEQIAALAPDLQEALRQAYRTGLSRIFLGASFVTFCALLLALTIPEIPLRSKEDFAKELSE